MSGAFRNEQKYICTAAELAELGIRLTGLMMPDPHAGTDGTYRVRSLYFDTYDDRLCRENEDGTSPREKWRIRSYNLDRSFVSLECKIHENDRVLKRICPISSGTADDILLRGKYPAIAAGNPPVLNRFLLLHQTQLLHPASVVDYIRRPLLLPEGNVRVTFDCALACTSFTEDYWKADASLRPVLPPGSELLEIKYDSFLPDFLYHAIQLRNMQRISFSKYYLSRRYHL